MLKKVVGLSAGMALAAAVLAGCGTTPSNTASAGSAPIHLTDDLHHTITLKKPATRIITLEPSNVEIALDLGLKSHLVGTDESTLQYTPAPWKAELAGLRNIGPSYPGINVEKVVAARPDLVIAGTGIKGISQLAQFHIPVLILNPTSINGVYHDLLLVGEATGKTAKATAVIQQMKAQVAAIEKKVATVKARPTVFYDLGGLYTTGGGTFLNSLIDMAGARNVGASLSAQPWPQVTAEQVVKANPEDILIDSGSGTSVSAEEQQAGFAVISAVRTHHVYEVPNPSYVDDPSPALVYGLRELIHLLHPNLKVGQ